MKAVFRKGDSLRADFGNKGAIRSNLTIGDAEKHNAYDGAYRFVPSENEQVVNIDGMYAKDDIIIERIPRNYGLITWNGSFIKVS